MYGDSRLARAVPFPEFAPDHLLRFSTRDMIDLQAFVTGVDPVDNSPEARERRAARPWLGIVERALEQQDAAFIREAVRLALRKPGGFERPALTDAELDDLPFAPAAVAQKIADALLCGVSGDAYETVRARRLNGADQGPLDA